MMRIAALAVALAGLAGAGTSVFGMETYSPHDDGLNAFLALLGVSEDDLFRDWEMSGLANPSARFVHEKCIDKFVMELKKEYPAPTVRESCEKFVRACGVTDEEIARVRKFMLEPSHPC